MAEAELEICIQTSDNGWLICGGARSQEGSEKTTVSDLDRSCRSEQPGSKISPIMPGCSRSRDRFDAIAESS